jgi:hypothetical protein
LIFLALFGFLPFIFDFGSRLFFGWGFHLVRIHEEGGGRLEAIAVVLSVACAVGAIIIRHAYKVPNGTIPRFAFGGCALAGALAGAIAVAAILNQVYWGSQHRVLGSSMERARTINCAGNLKQIGLALMIYADDHDGWLPTGEDFDLLREQQYLDYGRVYNCSATKRGHHNQSDDVVVDDYVYLGSGLRLYPPKADNGAKPFRDVEQTVILAHEGMNNHRYFSMVNCLLADGSVRQLRVGPNETFLEAVEGNGLSVARELSNDELLDRLAH